MDDGKLLVDDVIQYTYIYIFNLPTYLVHTWIRAILTSLTKADNYSNQCYRYIDSKEVCVACSMEMDCFGIVCDH